MAQSKDDWPMFGHDSGSTRYSELKQIDPANVSSLTRAWTVHLKSVVSAGAATSASASPRLSRISEATPIVVDGVMYLPTPYSKVLALDADTGKELWTYTLAKAQPSARGITFWAGDKQTPASIIFGTTDGHLISLDAHTGKPTQGFGTDGTVDMKHGIGEDKFPDARLILNSPVSIYKGVVVTGSQVQESPTGLAGDVRGWDAHTGALVWQFHVVPHDGETGRETWPADRSPNRTGNSVWGFMSVDVERGLVFLPISAPAYDFYGGDRKGNNLFGDSLVALDAKTGKLVWYFQTIHHDISDYDLESAPVLMDVRRNGKVTPAVAVVGKRGLMYILDRRDGKAIFGVEERPIPPGDVPGEQSSATQPFPLKPQPLGVESFQYEDMANVTPEHRKACEALYKAEGSMENHGPFTPFGSKMTVIFPGTLGVMNWHGFSYNPALGYAFVNTMNIGDVGKVTPAPADSRRGTPYQRTSPWGTFARFWQDDTFWPCQKPPWGQLWAINVNTGDVAWKVPFGTIPELEAKGITNTGAPNFGGSIATASGLVFIAATNDRRFRAFDAHTGKILWETQLETGSYNVPVTYRGRSGRQYVALVATGGSYYDRVTGDSLIAFALPVATP
jgi:glucose dehydrogenase